MTALLREGDIYLAGFALFLCAVAYTLPPLAPAMAIAAVLMLVIVRNEPGETK